MLCSVTCRSSIGLPSSDLTADFSFGIRGCVNAQVELAVSECGEETREISRERAHESGFGEVPLSQSTADAAVWGGRSVERRDDGAVLVREAGANVRFGHVIDAADGEYVPELDVTR